jgi:uncharacterized protein
MAYSSPSSDITSDDKLWALLGYLVPIIPIIVLLMEDKKNRPFIRFHAFNSLALLVLEVVLGAVTAGILGCLIWIYAIYLGVMAYQGKWTPIPVLTDFMKKQGWIS